MPEEKKYQLSTTLKKGSLPIILIAIVEAAHAALTSAGVNVDKAVLYTAAMSGYAALISLINWLKNKKKK